MLVHLDIVQVLSDTMADRMRNTGNDALSANIEFIDMFDKFFDCLNVKNMPSDTKEKNNFKAPY